MKIVFAEPIGLTSLQIDAFTTEMKRLGHSVKYYDAPPSDQADLVRKTTDADILVVSSYKVANEVIENSHTLKMIAVAFTGIDHIPLDLCRLRGILVCNAAGYSTQAVAELTISLAINLARNIIPLDGVTRAGGTRGGFVGGELKGKIFGIIGFGAIGERVAMLAKAFGCKVIAWSRSIKDAEGVEFVQFEELIKMADIISLHIPLNESTQGLINSNIFGLMKPSAILINTARGLIVDYEALANALVNKSIAGAAIDVYEQEPPIKDTHPLLSAPNTILLPHIGFATNEAIEERNRIVLRNIRNWMDGTPTNSM